MNNALALRKVEHSIENEKLLASLAHDGITASRDVTVELLRNPALTIILSAVAIEALQRVYVQTYEPSIYNPNVMIPTGKKPLLSQSFATTLESVILTTTAIESMGGLSGLLGLLGKFLR